MKLKRTVNGLTISTENKALTPDDIGEVLEKVVGLTSVNTSLEIVNEKFQKALKKWKDKCGEEVKTGKVYQINENVRIEEYEDKSFARWQVIVEIKGKAIDSVSTVFNDFYDALIYVGIYCKGVEVNRTEHLFGFVTELIGVGKSRFKNTRITKEVYDKLQKIND